MVVVVMRDIVAVRVIGEQGAYVYVVVPWLPAGVVVVQHGPNAGQQRHRDGCPNPASPRNQAPDCR